MKILNASIFFYIELVTKNQLSLFKKSLLEDELLLFENIIHNNFQTDVEASTKVFNIKSNSIKYQKIKKNLLDKTREASLFIKPSTKNQSKIYDEMIGLFSIEQLIKIYSLYTRKDLIMPLIEKNFQMAYKLFLHSSVIVMCQNLISFYSSTEPNTKQLEYYGNIYMEAINDFHQETKADYFYKKLNQLFTLKRNTNPSLIILEIEKYIKELKPYVGRVRSYKFHRDYYALEMMYYHFQNKFEDVIIVCDKNIVYLQSLPIESPAQLRQAYRRKAEHQIKLGLYDDALENINLILHTESVGSLSWLSTYYILISTYILQKKYTEANQITQILIENKNFKNIKSIFKRFISLINVYMYLFKLMNVIPNDTIEQKSEVKNYIKENPIFTKDKSGMNIPIIIAQLFEAIINNKDAEILDRIEALKKYSSRYITKNESIRSNCFINMLLEVVKQNFHLAAIERHTNKYYSKLIANPKISVDEATEIEFIPYEDLWQILMDYLKPNRKN